MCIIYCHPLYYNIHCLYNIDIDIMLSLILSLDLLLFLPPQYHILLKFISNESSTVTRIATDNWKLLPFIGEWLKQVSQ